jgi:hypothetical protein
MPGTNPGDVKKTFELSSGLYMLGLLTTTKPRGVVRRALFTEFLFFYKFKSLAEVICFNFEQVHARHIGA